MRCVRDKGRFASHVWFDDNKSIICNRCKCVLAEGIGYVTRKLFQASLKDHLYSRMRLTRMSKTNSDYFQGDQIELF